MLWTPSERGDIAQVNSRPGSFTGQCHDTMPFLHYAHEKQDKPLLQMFPGGRLNKKDGLTRYGNSHVKDKTS